jgi:hypothetical protein
MARPGFYNDNINRSYPFIHGQTAGLTTFAVADTGHVMGADSEFIEGTHRVYLSRIRRAQNTIEFEFRSDAPGLLTKVLFFTRQVTDPDYTTSYSSAIEESELDDLSPISCIADCNVDSEDSECSYNPVEPDPECHGDSAWTGFLVTGDLQELVNYLDDCELIECPGIDITICTFEEDVPIEPSLIQNLSGNYVRSINVANAERTRANTATECREYCWPFPLTDHYVACECLIGGVRFKEGYNACIVQDTLDNTITINACVGGGEGEPCSDVLLTDEEGPPDGRTTLDGAIKCDEVVRSINGVGKRFFEILGGAGVTVTSVPDEHKVIIDINLHTLAICPDFRDQSSINPIESSESSCQCGPEE